MTLFRLFLLALAVWILWRLLRGVRVHFSRVQPPAEPPQFEPMSRCTGCGVHLPAAALSAGGLCGKCAAAK